MKNYIGIGLCVILFSSCAHKITMGEQYSKLYEEKPTTILVMPPINNTNSVEAKEYFYSSLAQPLCEKGYYVLSPFLTMELLKQESAYDSENFLEGNLEQFRNVLGADAALFTIINKWKKNDLTSKITVGIEYKLRSTKTGETLYDRMGELKVDCKNVSNKFGLLAIAINALSTSLTDKVVAARICNQHVLLDFPAGKYSPFFGKDMKRKAGKIKFKESADK
jgi:hypothetical protein